MSFLRHARTALAAVALLATVGCSTAYKPGTPYFIEDVTVTAPAGVLSPGTAERIERDIESTVARAPREGEPKRLDVRVNSFRTKNPGMSLLIGDSNSMTGTAAITGAGVTEWSEDIVVMSDVLLQGVAGAIIAAARQRDAVETGLAGRFAATVARLAYGGKLPAASAQRPAPATAPAAPASRTPAAPRAGAVAAGV